MDKIEYIIAPDGRAVNVAEMEQTLRIFNDACVAWARAVTEAIRPFFDAVAAWANDPVVDALLADIHREERPSLPRHGASRAMRERRRRA
jgi:hypothetical protein